MRNKCPLCNSVEIKDFKRIKSTEIDGSLLYNSIIVLECNECGHIFNELSVTDRYNLEKYYINDYKDGKFSPTVNENNYFDVKESNSFIINQNHIENYVGKLIRFNNLISTRMYDFLALDQFLEHCYDMPKVIKNIKRLSSENGLLYISVPDARRYRDNGIPYMFLIKEHVQHFSFDNIVQFFKKHGFELLESNENTLDIINGKFKMPNMEFLFENKNKFFDIDGTYCYGISREFLYLMENNPYLKKTKISGLIDDTPIKIDKTLNDINISSSLIISELSEKSTIVITSLYHKIELIKKIKSLGFKGTINDSLV